MTEFKPNSWSGIDYENDLHRDTDNGFLSGPEVSTLFTAPIISNDPGEVWQIATTVILSTEPSDNLAVLRYRDSSDNVVARDSIQDFGGIKLEVSTVIESSNVGGDLSIEIELVGSDSSNYFALTESRRLRRPSATNTLTNGSGDSFTG